MANTKILIDSIQADSADILKIIFSGWLAWKPKNVMSKGL